MMQLKSVDEYIKHCPEETRERLLELRNLIKQIAPNAKEKISYSMPFYEYKGRLVYFALMKNYIGLYIPPPIIDDFKNELKNFKTTKSSVHLPLTEALPRELIEKMIKARIAWNDKITS